MKAIALLTMVFLPGTFVAVSGRRSVVKACSKANICGLKSFFAMPLLDWQAPRGTSVVSHRFWIYWAVTVPLTAAVLLLWATWYVFSGRQRTQPCLPREKVGRSGHSGQRIFEMHVFTALGLDRIRRRSRGPVGDENTEGMTDDIA